MESQLSQTGALWHHQASAALASTHCLLMNDADLIDIVRLQMLTTDTISRPRCNNCSIIVDMLPEVDLANQL